MTAVRSRSDRCPSCGRKHKRSNPANARLWLLYHLAAAKLKTGEESYSAEQFHYYYRSRFLGCDDVRLPNGKVLTIPRSTAQLDVDEFNAYMTAVEADLAERDVFMEELVA